MTEGLEGVIAARTILSDVDGDAGRLVIRGYSLDQLAGRTRFAAAAHLLLDGFFEDLPDVVGLEARLGLARAAVFARIMSTGGVPTGLNAVESVRALLARLPDGDDLHTAVTLLSAPAVFTAAVARNRNGLEPIRPDPALDHAADTLRMVRGVTASPAEAAALDTYLVTVCDHGLNASTFAARVTASTGASLAACALAGLAALSGPLHGGMVSRVQVFSQEARRSGPQAAVGERLAMGAGLPGFGHPLYPDGDPRARALLSAFRPHPDDAELAAAVRDMTGERPNIDFALSALADRLPLPADAPFQIFAVARCAGWIAHALEQSKTGRLIRPRARYVGVQPRDGEADADIISA